MARTALIAAVLSSLVTATPSGLDKRQGCATCPPTSCDPTSVNSKYCEGFSWGSIGDSWSSGVAYSVDVEYDSNTDNCLRINHAYSAQLESDKTWTQGEQKAVFNGCSGSQLVDMHGFGNQGRQLINKLDAPTATLMQAGGNNCGFADIAVKCVFQPDPTHDYGKDFADDTDCSSECCQALNHAQDYINDPSPDHGLMFDFRATLDDLFTTAQLKDGNRWLYVIGYAHFFNTDTSGPDTCDDWSFGAFYHKPKVSQKLRQRMNDVLNDFNNRYQDVINAYAPPENKHVGFVSITEGFNGHRFCEAGANYDDQWYSTDTWLWNLSFWNGNTDLRLEDAAITLDDGLGQDIAATLGSDGSGGSGSGDVSKGWMLRPFHPKEGGHTSIKDTILARMRADQLPGLAFT